MLSTSLLLPVLMMPAALPTHAVGTPAGAAIVTATVDAAALAVADEFPDEWFWRMGKTGTAHKAMTGKPAPELKVKAWSLTPAMTSEATPELSALLKELNAESDGLDALKGKVVVVDFWATWCGPCRAALPENVTMMKELGPKGLVVLGVHDASRGSERMNEVAGGVGVNYPLAIDDSGRSAAAWKVGFWPTYGVIDRKGILRAVGLQPQHVRTVAEKLLAEASPSDETPAAGTAREKRDAKETNDTQKTSATPTKDESGQGSKATGDDGAKAKADRAAQVPALYLEGDARKRARLAMFDLCPEAPALGAATQWTNVDALGDARTLSELKGKIVVLDFWATWCGPCIQSIPKNNELAKRYADRGVVLIGVCHKDGGEKMVETIRSKKIEYPCAIDAKGEANAAYKVDGYPDYVIIDREGRVRGADVQNGEVVNAIEWLLREEPAFDQAPASRK